ncbi:MAG TPA: sulfotransferase domain-containing protein [Caulobacteraceae bacterium]|nr:sulfotransferase domain-containing protein [Caulobacteraceae bacterium]
MDAPTPHRARNMDEMRALQGRMFAAADFAGSIAAWKPRPTDVVITPYGKCGTTRLQQMFHTLRTRGDADFDDISRVVPWIETSRLLGLDLEAPQKAEPRGFKSHLGADQLPAGAKAIVSFRDPKDALVSHFRFMEGWFLEPGAVPIADYAAVRLRGRGEGQDYWSHLLSWWARRNDPAVLLLSYEATNADPAAAVRVVARFCGFPLDEELLALTLERTSLAYMLAHKSQFDDLMMRQASERLAGLPPGSDSAKVRRGAVGSHRDDLPASIGESLDAVWREAIASQSGFADYAAFETAVRERMYA